MIFFKERFVCKSFIPLYLHPNRKFPDGVISVAANAYPKAFSDMIRLSLQHKFPEANAIHYKLLKAYDYMFAENNPAGVKAFLHEMGLIENVLRLPVTPVSNALQEQIKAYVKNF